MSKGRYFGTYMKGGYRATKPVADEKWLIMAAHDGRYEEE